MPDTPIPSQVIQEATRLSRLAYRADTSDHDRSDERTHYTNRRTDLLEQYDYTAHIRDDADPTVVFYPTDWVTDGNVDLDNIQDTGNAIERPLTGGDGDDYDAVAPHNQSLVDTIADAYGEPHASNAAAFATFMNNHRSRRIETATAADITEFLEEYYPRNTWPTDDQRHCICRSLRYTLNTALEHSA